MFEIGDLVQLKSGGPVMTIEGILKPADSDQKYRVVWFSGDENKEAVFPEQALNSYDWPA